MGLALFFNHFTRIIYRISLHESICWVTHLGVWEEARRPGAFLFMLSALGAGKEGLVYREYTVG